MVNNLLKLRIGMNKIVEARRLSKQEIQKIKDNL
jgi:hypothetical protein